MHNVVRKATEYTPIHIIQLIHNTLNNLTHTVVNIRTSLYTEYSENILSANIKVFKGEIEGKRPRGRPRRRWIDNFK